MSQGAKEKGNHDTASLAGPHISRTWTVLVVLTLPEEVSGAIEAAAVTERRLGRLQSSAWKRGGGLKKTVLVADGEPAKQALVD